MHWKGLVYSDFFERRLLGAIDGPDPREIKIALSSGADAFLQLYGEQETRGKKEEREAGVSRSSREGMKMS